MIFNDSRYPDLFLYGGFDFDLVRYGESFENVRVCEGGGGDKGTLECCKSPWMIGQRQPPNFPPPSEMALQLLCGTPESQFSIVSGCATF